MPRISASAFPWVVLAFTPLLMAPAMCGNTGPVNGCPPTFPPAAAPGGIAVSPDGTRAFVAADFSFRVRECNTTRRYFPAVSVVDLPSSRLLATIDLPARLVGSSPPPLQVEIVGDEVLVLSAELRTGPAVYATLPLAGPWTAAAAVETPGQPLAMATASGRAFLLLRGGAEVLVHTPGQPDQALSLPGGHRTAAIRAAHGMIEVATESEIHEVDPATLAIVRTLPLGGCHVYPDAADALAPIGAELAVVCEYASVAFGGSPSALLPPATSMVVAVDGSDGEATGLASLLAPSSSSTGVLSASGFGATSWPGALTGRAVFVGGGVAYAPLGSGVARLSLADATLTMVQVDNDVLTPRTLGAPRGGSPLLVARPAAINAPLSVELLALDPGTGAVLGAPLPLGPPPAFLAASARD
jgi:hypothetical protein